MPDWADRFIDALTLTPNITAAALGAGIDRSHAYYVKSQDADFSRRWDNALASSLDALEANVFDRAKNSDTLAIFLLKSHRREVYGERMEQAHTGGLTIRVLYADAEKEPAPIGDGRLSLASPPCGTEDDLSL